MKLDKFLFGILVTSLFWVSCKKNDLTQHNSPANNLRLLGAVKEDPALVAKVPMIISSDFFGIKNTGALTKNIPVKGGPKGSDITPPAISITSPAGGTSFTSGDIVDVVFNATDNVGISTESFSVDGALQTTISSTVNSFSWNTTAAASGTHTLSVSVADAAGNTAETSITVAINSVIVSSGVLPSFYNVAMPVVGDQGNEGSCTAFAVGYNARSAEQYYKTHVGGYNYSTDIFSPEYLFDQIKTDAATCSNSTIIGALEFLKSNGICTWSTMPYSSWDGCSLRITHSETSEAANYKITNYSTLYTADLSAIKTMLSMNHPLIISFMVDDSFMWAKPGFIWSAFSSTIYGLHCVTICGYDDVKHAVKVVNSWGSGWADGGYAYIDYDFLKTLNSNVYMINL